MSDAIAIVRICYRFTTSDICTVLGNMERAIREVTRVYRKC